jgi:HAD superfamily hydrolase (TIGR01509 family)
MTLGRPTVLFDVDGTLVDSNYLHTIAWSRALIDGGEWAPMNAIHRLIGMGSDNMLPALIGRPDQAIADGWRHHYEPMMGEVRAFPGATALLQQLAAGDVAVVLATSSPAEHLERLIHLLQVEDALATTTSSDDVDRSKPEPDIFLIAMHRAGGTPDSTVVVGDSTWDIQAAAAARLRCVGVETGGFSEAELIEAGAIAVYRDVEALRQDLSGGPLAELVPS